MFQLPSHLLQKLLYNLPSSHASLEQFSQHLSEMLFPELKSSESLLNKTQPDIVGCVFPVDRCTTSQASSLGRGHPIPTAGAPTGLCTPGLHPRGSPATLTSLGTSLKGPGTAKSPLIHAKHNPPVLFFLNRVTQAQPLHTALAQPGAVLLAGTRGFLHCCTHSRGRKPHTRTTAAGRTWALERPLLTLWVAGCRGPWGMSPGATLACPRPLLPADGHCFHLPCFPKLLRTGGGRGRAQRVSDRGHSLSACSTTGAP